MLMFCRSAERAIFAVSQISKFKHVTDELNQEGLFSCKVYVEGLV